MTETKDSLAGLTPEEIEELEFQKKAKDARKEKMKLRRPGGGVALTPTSLLDIMTILLVFMLKNYATNPMNINPSGDLRLVKSTDVSESHKHLVPLAITSKHILVDDKPVVQVKDGKVSATAKREGGDGYFITPLFDALQATAEHQKKLAEYNSSVKFEGELMIVADKDVPFRLLSEVLYTAGQAEFGKFEFAVIRL